MKYSEPPRQHRSYIKNFFDKKPYNYITQKSEWLYEIEVTDIDYDYAYNWFESHYVPSSGCSALWTEGIVARNLDWEYKDQIECVVKTTANNDRFASIGVASLTDITRKQIKHPTDKAKLLPFVVDGVNEKGVFIAPLVVPDDDGKINQHRGKKRTPASMVVRLILDSCSTAKQGAEKIRDEFDLFYPIGRQNTHFLVADAKEAYLVEIINNETIVTQFTDETLPAILTNFHLNGVQLTEDKQLDWNTVEDGGAGLERYQLMLDSYDSLEVESDFTDLFTNELKYSNAYTTLDGPNPWKTEFTHDLGLTIHDELPSGSIELAKQAWEQRSFDDEVPVWITTHTCLYDLRHKMLKIVGVWEQPTEYEYQVEKRITKKALQYKL